MESYKVPKEAEIQEINESVDFESEMEPVLKVKEEDYAKKVEEQRKIQYEQLELEQYLQSLKIEGPKLGSQIEVHNVEEQSSPDDIVPHTRLKIEG